MASPTKAGVVLLASEWGSKHGGLSTFNRVLAIELAKQPEVQVSVLVPDCTQDEKDAAKNNHGIALVQPKYIVAIENELDRLYFPPDDLQIDFVVGHGVVLGKCAQAIRESRQCKWIQFVHTDPEELGMFKEYNDAISRGEKKLLNEVVLCEKADHIVAVGPKLAEAYRFYLRPYGKDQDVFELTPGLFSEFSDTVQSPNDLKLCRVLAFGRGDPEDFSLKGFDLAAEAVGRLSDTQLIFVGAQDKSQAKVADRFQEWIRRGRVKIRTFKESREDLKKQFSEADIAIMPSRTEGFGLSALEAMSAGLPVFASDNSGFGEALKKVKFGSQYVFPADDAMVLADKIKAIWDRDRAVRLAEAEDMRQNYGNKYSWEEQCRKLVKDILKGPLPQKEPRTSVLPRDTALDQPESATMESEDSSLPPEIRARGPAAKRAFQKAMRNGEVKVYRGRIMLLGQDRAGKTSLKKSLLGMPFNPQEESTIGVEVDPSKCEVEVDQVKNWEPTERNKLEVSEFVEDIARLIAKDLNETETEEKDIGRAEEAPDNSDEVDAGSENPTQAESKSETSRNASAVAVDTPSDSVAEEQSNTEHEIQLNVDTNETLPNDVTKLVVQYLQSLKLEVDIKPKEFSLTLWDFAGQHLYYASHSVFLSERAVYVLVYNLNKDLMAEAKPCVRQGINEKFLDNPNGETNLDNLLSWLVSIHSIRATDGEVKKKIQGKLSYLRPPVFIVGTNADQPFQVAEEMENCIKKNIRGKSYGKHVIRQFFTVDNKNSQSDKGVEKLRKKIMEVLKEEPYMGAEVPLRWFNFEKVVEALVAKKTYHMDLGQLQAVIRQVCRVDDQNEMTTMLNFYHDLGVIVKHGHTVVLQAQWLIDLFKKLITVRRFDEFDPLYSDYWEELEENGILRMALVDHVFTDFIEKGLNKHDILGMMERYGLIAKFSCLSSENEDEHRYFVPAQLTSSPEGLWELRPSAWDPCPLYVHFLDGFVPHGLFQRLVSRCIVWCSEHGTKQAPQLFNNGARLFIGAQSVVCLSLVCKKRFIRVILKRNNPSSLQSPSTSTSQKIAVEVRTFIERTLEEFSRDLSWLHNFRHELSVACTFCAKHSERCSKPGSICCRHDDCLHLLPVRPGEELICRENFSNEVIKVFGLEKWFQGQKSQNEELGVDPLVPDGLDQPLSLKTSSPSSDDLLLVAHELATSWKRLGQATSWKMLGQVLGLPEAQLEQIEKGEAILSGKCENVLRNWTLTFGSDATYSRLRQALQLVGRPELAVKYCDAHACAVPKEVSKKVPQDALLWLSRMIGKWEPLACSLGFTDAAIYGIQQDKRGNNSAQVQSMLSRWKGKKGAAATLQVLCEALRDQNVERTDLAEELENGTWQKH